jgi:uncharacterized membrane protein (UPF0127 family)
MPRFRVKLAPFFLLALLAVFWVGCQKADTTATNAATTDTNGLVYEIPAHAQPRLQTVKIYLGAETMDAEMAITRDENETGLMYRTNIDDSTAMLFYLRQPMLPPGGFWMTNCPISLSAAYIGPDGVIEEIHHLEKNNNVPVVATNDNIIFVLEVNDGWFARHNIGTGTLIKTERGTLMQTFGQ